METHWRVEVSVNGESILSIEPQMLAGKADTTEEEEAAIRTAAEHLSGFLGQRIAEQIVPPPPHRNLTQE